MIRSLCWKHGTGVYIHIYSYLYIIFIYMYISYICIYHMYISLIYRHISYIYLYIHLPYIYIFLYTNIIYIYILFIYLIYRYIISRNIIYRNIILYIYTIFEALRHPAWCLVQPQISGSPNLGESMGPKWGRSILRFGHRPCCCRDLNNSIASWVDGKVSIQSLCDESGFHGSQSSGFPKCGPSAMTTASKGPQFGKLVTYL